jgi:exopolysaccharide production protein ExoQ
MVSATTTDGSGDPAMGRMPGHGRGPKSLLDERTSARLDQFAVWGWAICMAFPFPFLSPLRYVLALYFTAGLFLFARQLMPVALRSWPMFIYPVLAIIAMLWSNWPADTFRKALLMTMTALIPIFLAGRVSARHYIAAMFVCQLVAGMLSAINPDVGKDGFATGIYDQKNFLAINMFFLHVAAMVLILDSRTPALLRMLSWLGPPIALYMIFLSESATTILLSLAASAAFLFHAFVWNPATRVRHMRTLMTFSVVLIVIIAALIFFGLMQTDVMAAVLEAFGKDSTLTGRTVLWAQAERLMEQHPWTGLGPENFWRPEIGQANSILNYFHVEEMTADQFEGFSFHNSYYENGVALGYPGYYATIFLAAWCLYQTGRNWLMDQSLYNTFFVIIAGMVVLRSNTEGDLNTELGTTLIPLLLGAARCGVWHAHEHTRPGQRTMGSAQPSAMPAQ